MFQLTESSLAGLLTRIPLYAMLVDVEEPREAALVGSALIDLSCFAQEVCSLSES